MKSLFPDAELVQYQASRWLGGTPISVQEQTGGLSGTRVWRVETVRGTFALRQYPVEFPTEERLRWLHGFLKEVQVHGCGLLPCPISTREGSTWIKQDLHYWEMLTWHQGESLLELAPSRELLIAAATALARLHVVTAQIPISKMVQPGQVLVGAGRGLSDRLKLVLNWKNQHAEQVERCLDCKSDSPRVHHLFRLQKAAFQQHEVAFRNVLQQALQLRDRLLPVLRDVQPGHVIFARENVAGFIDITAARIDSALGDLARLLHRWRFAEPNWYAAGLSAYQEIRPLPATERQILDAYDYSARLLSGIQWLQWIVLEEREFANQQLVEQHLERIERDLERLLDQNPDTMQIVL